MISRMGIRRGVLSLGIVRGLTVLSAQPGLAHSAWDDIRADMFGGRPIEDGQGIINLKAPSRALDQRFVPISVDAALTDGPRIEAITVIVDDNPAPVGALFRFASVSVRRSASIFGSTRNLRCASLSRRVTTAST